VKSVKSVKSASGTYCLDPSHLFLSSPPPSLPPPPSPCYYVQYSLSLFASSLLISWLSSGGSVAGLRKSSRATFLRDPVLKKVSSECRLRLLYRFSLRDVGTQFPPCLWYVFCIPRSMAERPSADPASNSSTSHARSFSLTPFFQPPKSGPTPPIHIASSLHQ
jgi:hypothetical protein